MKILALIPLLFLLSCTNVNFTTSKLQDGSYKIDALETSLFSECKTLMLELSNQKSGQIKQIYWKTQPLINQPLQEAFLSKKNNFKDPQFRLMNFNDGLIIADKQLKGSYLFRRSYNLFYDEGTEEYVIEINYLAKNHHESKSLKYQWSSQLDLKDIPIDLTTHGDWKSQASDRSGEGSLTFKLNKPNPLAIKIIASGIRGLKLDLTQNDQIITMSNAKEFDLGYKEKMSWKIQLRLKEIN